MMLRLMMLMATTALLAVAGAADAAERLPLHMSGEGVFGINTLPNIGTLNGGNAGVVIGNGSGITAYRAVGNDFTLGGVQLGYNEHYGANISRTTGVLQGNLIRWPAHSVHNPDPLAPAVLRPGLKNVHIARTLYGDLYFTYSGRYELTPPGPLYGYANFVIVGGTGRFEQASGRVDVVVISADPNPTDGADFHYEFDGFVILKD